VNRSTFAEAAAGSSEASWIAGGKMNSGPMQAQNTRQLTLVVVMEASAKWNIPLVLLVLFVLGIVALGEQRTGNHCGPVGRSPHV
jgi:hypothetical protein